MKRVSMNDITDIYKKPLINTASGYECPVCGKTYKSLNAANTHLESESCADYHTLYDNTEEEIFGCKVYTYVIAEISPSSRVTFSVFKKSQAYSGVMRLVTFLNYYSMREHYEMYISWLVVNKKANHTNQLLKYAVNHDNIAKYKLDVHALGLFDTKPFMERYKDRLMEDGQFFIRSLETCKLCVLDVLEDSTFDHTIDNLAADYKERCYDLVDQVVERKKQLKSGKR